MSTIIPVLPVVHPTLCYAQKLDPPGAMTRCTKPKGHAHTSGDEKHSWQK